MSRPASASAQTVERLAALETRQGGVEGRLDDIGRHLEEGRRAAAEDRRAAAEDRRLILSKLDEVHGRVTKTEVAVAPLIERVDAHHARLAQAEEKISGQDKRLVTQEVFRGRIGAVVTVAGSSAALLGTGLWYLVGPLWADIAAYIKRLLP